MVILSLHSTTDIHRILLGRQVGGWHQPRILSLSGVHLNSLLPQRSHSERLSLSPGHRMEFDLFPCHIMNLCESGSRWEDLSSNFHLLRI